MASVQLSEEFVGGAGTFFPHPVVVGIGDVHGKWQAIRDVAEQAQGSLIIQVGDFGLGFDHPIKDYHNLRRMNDVMKISECTLLVIRGNHDCPHLFTKYSKAFSNIWLVPDYTQIHTTAGSIFLAGGAISVDRSDRILGRSWWDGEEMSFKPEQVIKSDILITHTGPEKCGLDKAETNDLCIHYNGVEAMMGGNLFGDLKEEQQICQQVSDLCECKTHYFGHYHRSTFFVDDTANRRYICLNINECREISKPQ